MVITNKVSAVLLIVVLPIDTTWEVLEQSS